MLGGAALLTPWRALGFDEGAALKINLLDYDGGNPDPRPGAWRKLLLEVEKRTSILIDPELGLVRADADELFSSPFLVWTGDSAFLALSEAQREGLRVFIESGGFLLIDGADEGDGFDLAVRAELAEIAPSALSAVAQDHVIFQSFYILERPWGRLDKSSVLEAVDINGRLAVVYTPNDLQGAWARDELGNPLFELSPGGDAQRDLAFRFGINLVMYAMCIDYKADQVHIPFILKRREWRLE